MAPLDYSKCNTIDDSDEEDAESAPPAAPTQVCKISR